MKVTQTVVQVVIDQLFGTRLDLSHGLGWIMAVLSRGRPVQTGIRMENEPAGRLTLGAPGATGSQRASLPQPECPRPSATGSCPVMNVAPDWEMLEDLRRVYAITDNFSMYFYRALGRFDPETLVMRFGSWLDACEQAGLIGIAGVLPGDDLGQEDFLQGLRPCLSCNREFKSQGLHNRLCPPCRDRIRK